MAGFNFAPITLQPQQQTSLGDMLNIARNAQAFQQAQQSNPLTLQQQQAQTELAQTNLQKAKALLNPEIEKGIAESETAGNSATLKRMELADKQAEKIQTGQISLINNHLVIKAEKNPDSLTQSEKDDLIKLVRDNALMQAKNSGINDLSRVSELADPYLNVAKKNPSQLRAFALERHIAGLNSAADIKSALTPSGIAVNTGAGGYNVNTNPLSGTAVGGIIPGTQFTQKQAPGTIIVNGVVGQYDASGNFVPLSVQPGKATTPSGNVAPSVETSTKPGMPKLLQIDEPRSPGQFNEQESARFKLGAEDFNKIQQRATLAQESALDASIIKKSLAAASGGKPGQIMRDTGQFLFGDAQKDELVKTLARNAVNQSALMGVKNEAAGQDVKVANGSEQITAEALAHIVERIESTNLAAQKYNQALIKLQEKHGKDKAYLNNDNFKAAWGSAYDPVAFIIQNTNRQNIPQKDKDKIIDYYTRDMSQDQLDALHDSQVKLKRLERGDF